MGKTGGGPGTNQYEVKGRSIARDGTASGSATQAPPDYDLQGPMEQISGDRHIIYDEAEDFVLDQGDDLMGPLKDWRNAGIAAALTVALATTAGCSSDNVGNDPKGPGDGAGPETTETGEISSGPEVGKRLTRGEFIAQLKLNRSSDQVVHMYQLRSGEAVVVSPDKALPSDVLSETKALNTTSSDKKTAEEVSRIASSLVATKIPMFVVSGTVEGYSLSAINVEGMEFGYVESVGLHKTAQQARDAAESVIAEHPGVRVIVSGEETLR